AVRPRQGAPVPAYTEVLAAAFGAYMPGAAALQTALLRRPAVASAGIRLLTAPGVGRLMAGTWSLYWNGLVDGARPRPSAWSAGVVQRVAGVLGARAAGRGPGPAPRGGARAPAPRPPAATGSATGRPGARAGQR